VPTTFFNKYLPVPIGKKAKKTTEGVRFFALLQTAFSTISPTHWESIAELKVIFNTVKQIPALSFSAT